MRIHTLALAGLLLTNCSTQTEEIENPVTGQLELKYEYYENENGQKIKHGECIEWYADGTKRLVSNYLDGELNGESIFYKNKDTIAYNNYKDGILHGTCLLKNSNDVVLAKYTYLDGVLDGKQEYYHANGKIRITGNFTLGISDGEWVYFSRNGKKAGSLNVDLGTPKELIGKWKVKDKKEAYYEFNEDGDYTYSAPLFKYSSSATQQLSGIVQASSKIQLLSRNGRFSFTFEVIEIQNDVIKLIDENGSEVVWERV